MSGAFGWNRHGGGGNDTVVRPSPQQGAFDDARNRHQGGASAKPTGGVKAKKTVVADTADNAQARDLHAFAQKALPKAVAQAVPNGLHKTVCSASNVVVIVLDGTISMDGWREEIYKRLPLFYHEASAYLGTDDLEVLFVVHGDVRGDRYPIQIGKIGRGPELDLVLASFDMRRLSGGGQGSESHEVVMYYLARQVDFGQAQNVYTFFITDEAACDKVDERAVEEHLGLTMPEGSVDTKFVLAVLKRKMHLYAVLCETDSYDPAPIKEWWEKHLQGEHVLPLSDKRRAVDVMLGTMATLVGKQDRFVDDLKTRLLPTPHGAQNVHTVLTAITLVGKGTPTDPFHQKSRGGQTKPLE